MVEMAAGFRSLLPSGTVTFLFTDLEGSTRLWELYPEQMKQALAQHDDMLRQAIERNGGKILKHTGDGVMAVFETAMGGVQAAVAIQQAFTSAPSAEFGPGSLRVRISLHTGEPQERAGDYYGPVLNRASRLLSVAHGGQTLVSGSTADLLRDQLREPARLKDLGEYHLPDLARPEHIYQLVHPGLRADFPPPRSVHASPHNLPVQTTTFVGRREDLAAVQRLLTSEDVRLVTLTGPGGTGKTRLSLQVASQLLDGFPDGAFFVSLAEVSDSTFVIPRIAEVLGVREGSNRPLLGALKDYLQNQRLLLILDNFEHLISAAPVVADLLTAVPQVKVLVSSRTVLRLTGEHEYPLQPLDIPAPADQPALDQLRHNESVQLFAQRAQAANPSFEVTPQNASDIAEICRRLEGLPLAIELAAARTKLLPPKAMLSRLSHPLALLTGGARDRPARQQTLRNTLEWSYSLLGEPERVLFARLSVFAGGFDLDAAEPVCNQDGRLDVMTGIESLLNNSLIRQEEDLNGQRRFKMLETVREYAHEQLEARGELESAQKAHAVYYYKAALAGTPYFQAHGPNNMAWLRRLDVENDNIRAALACGLSMPEASLQISQIMLPLTWFWYRRGFLGEGRRWADQYLASSLASQWTLEHARFLHSRAMLSLWQGDLKRARADAEQAVATLERLESEDDMPLALMSLGVIYINMGKDELAHPLLKESHSLFEGAGNTYFHIIVLVHLGNVSLGLGKPDEARDWLEQAYNAVHELGENWVLSFIVNNLGEVARVQGDYEAAGRYYRESESLLRDIGDKGDLARLIHTLGYIELHEGRLDRAEERLRESVAMFRKLGNRRGLAECVAAFASLKAAQGQPQRAARLLSAAEASMKESGAAWWPADRVEIERSRAGMKAALGEEGFAAEWVKGRAMSLDQALAGALANE